MIDITTLFVTLVLIDIVIAIILLVVGRQVDSSLLYWAAGYGINSVAYVLVALRGDIPDILSVLTANSLVAATYAFYALGLLKFLNRMLSWPLALVIWGPLLVVVCVFPLLPDNLEARIVVGGVVNGFQAATLLMLLLHNSVVTVGRGKYILMTAFAIGVGIAVARPLALMLDIVHISAVNSPGIWQTLTFIPLLLLNIAIALGLVLMQKEHAEAATSEMARLDELTGLANRRRIYENINQIMIDCEKKKTFAALLLIDLDHFKAVNDQYGHAVGDDLLCQAADRIRDCMSAGDTAARLGGDEFVVLLNNLARDYDSARRHLFERADHLRKKLGQPYTLKQDVVHRCSGSIGMAIVEPGMKDRETILREADQAMYQAKNSDKGSIALGSDKQGVQGTAVSSASGVTRE